METPKEIVVEAKEATEEARICCAPQCTKPGTSLCASCRLVGYCCRECQLEDWPRHKEECQGHLRKTGIAHLVKAQGLPKQASNLLQVLRCCDLALAKLNLLNDKPLEAISEALGMKADALGNMSKFKESLECTKEWWTLWSTARGPSHPTTINATFSYIQCLIFNEEFVEAESRSRKLYETINSNNDEENRIPEDKRQLYLARGAGHLAQAIYQLAKAGGIPPEEQPKAGQEAIALAQKSLEINTEIYGAESAEVVDDKQVLQVISGYFNSSENDQTSDKKG